MKKLLVLLLAAGLTLTGGCKKDSKPSGPSKTGPSAGANPSGAGAEAPAGKKVALKFPTKVDLAPGKPPYPVKIQILRGPEAKGSFTLTFTPANKDVDLTVNPTPFTVKPEDKEVTAFLTAGGVGLTTVNVTGQGAGATIDPAKFEVEVQ